MQARELGHCPATWEEFGLPASTPAHTAPTLPPWPPHPLPGLAWESLTIWEKALSSRSHITKVYICLALGPSPTFSHFSLTAGRVVSGRPLYRWEDCSSE